LRFPFFQEGADPFHIVLGPAGDALEIALQVELFGEGVGVAFIDCPFDQAKTHRKVSGGWVAILDLLKVVAEGGRPSFKWRAMYWMMDRFGWVMPKSTRADEVIRSGG